MSKRSRRPRDEARPADHSEIRPGQHGPDEPTMVVAGEAFVQFETWLDQQLETLVGRWIHVAAPAASAVRRLFLQASRRRNSKS